MQSRIAELEAAQAAAVKAQESLQAQVSELRASASRPPSQAAKVAAAPSATTASMAVQTQHNPNGGQQAASTQGPQASERDGAAQPAGSGTSTPWETFEQPCPINSPDAPSVSRLPRASAARTPLPSLRVSLGGVQQQRVGATPRRSARESSTAREESDIPFIAQLASSGRSGGLRHSLPARLKATNQLLSESLGAEAALTPSAQAAAGRAEPSGTPQRGGAQAARGASAAGTPGLGTGNAAEGVTHLASLSAHLG